MNYLDLANKYATQYGLDPQLYTRLIQQESGFNPQAVSSKGAMGLTQVMPATGGDPGYGVKSLDPNNPEDQVRFGAEYLSKLRDHYGGDMTKALAAYNWGPGNVNGWNGDMNALPKETRDYVNSIMQPNMTATMSSMNGPEGAYVPQIGDVTQTSLETGMTPNGVLTHQAQYVNDHANANAMWDALGQNNSTQNGMLSQDQTPAKEAEKNGLLAKILPNMSDSQRKSAMLAIGAGLLSGNDWSSGLAHASQNLLSMDVMNQKQQASQNGYNVPFNVVGIDPKTGQKRVMAGTMRGGVPYVQDGNNLVPASSILQNVRIGGRNDTQAIESKAGGIPGATAVVDGVPQFQFSTDSQRKTYRYALRAIGASRDMDNIMSQVGMDKVTSISSNLKRWAATHSNDKITNNVINSVVNDSGLQGALASTMSSYLQAVLRADTGAAYTGTEFNNYGSAFLPSSADNPEEAAQKKRLRIRELYGMAGSAGPASTYLTQLITGDQQIPGGYWSPVSKDALSGGSNGSSKGDGPPPPPDFPGSPDDWKYLRPEERKLFQ